MSLELTPEQYRTILESLPSGVCIVDCDGRVVLWNDGAERITGFRRSEVVGRCGPDHAGSGGNVYGSTIFGGVFVALEILNDGRPREARLKVRHKDGRHIHLRGRGFPLRDSAGVMIGAVGTFDESRVESELGLEQQLKEVEAATDLLAGIASRPVIQAFLEASFAELERDKSPFSLLTLAMRGIEKFRRDHSPQAAEKLLQTIARTLAGSVPSGDLVGYLGENRLVVILRRSALNATRQSAERLQRIASGTGIYWWGDRLVASVSLGGTAVCTGDDPDSLLGRSEIMLRSAMETGRIEIE
jgi:diguanylate cyclase (GGDEF)-like protein